MTWGPRRAVFCGVRSVLVFFVAKAANEGADAGRESVVARTQERPKKEFRIEFSFFRGVLAGIWGDVV